MAFVDFLKIVLRDIDLFDCKNVTFLFLCIGYDKHTNLWESFVDFDICHRMASLRKLYFVTLTYFLKVKNKKNFKTSEMVRASTKMCEILFIDFDICHQMVLLH